MPNDWREDWVVSGSSPLTSSHVMIMCVQEFYCQMRLGKQMELIETNVSAEKLLVCQ